ncbi:MAG TPA: APC family permease [Acidimicrobiales bacterium]|jgi:amino acid transporter|nr:APC family permease [Acidimicrobiales bacterium]
MTDQAAPAPPHAVHPVGLVGDKGLKSGALGLISSTVVGVASTAPAYSLAATLGFVVISINGLQAPIISILAFVPMLLISYAYKEMNYADPDCGTTFTWATRAFGPKTGWLGGWGVVMADLLVMASLAQIAGQYVFFLFNANGVGGNSSSGWVLLVGVIWIVLMTGICYVGIEISANFQKALLGIELTMLLVLSIVALVKVGAGTAPLGHLTPSLSWFNPFNHFNATGFMAGFTLMLFIYWGWDTTVSVNEETADPQTTPGRAAVLSTLVLLATYALVIIAAQSYDGIGTKGIGLRNPANSGDVLKVMGSSIFGSSGFGSVLSHLLILMVLSSAAASTQTTILPTARTTLSMAVYKAIPSSFGKIHKRFLTPTVSTVAMGGASIALYVVMNYLTSGGAVIVDSVSALGAMIAFYYGLTGFSCAWYYRSTLRESARNFWIRGVLPVLGGLILYGCLLYNLWHYWNPINSYTSWSLQFPPHWHIGGVFVLDVGALLLGVVLMYVFKAVRPAFFRGEVLNRDTPTRVPQDIGVEVGLFGIDPFEDGPAGTNG